MYRILPISKDTYLTNKIVAGSGSTSSNVGQAGTLDLYKIWTQIPSGSTPTVENSRLLVQPNLDSLRALTGSLLNINDSSFKCYLSLKDVYGGQTTPSNFVVVLNPMSRSWDEGRGRDVRLYRDLDAANWVTASVDSGTPTAWAVTGANSPTTDYLTSYEVSQTFSRGDEDLLMDVTSIVSATLAGGLPESGWRLAFSASFENDENTYFVKRFGARHTSNLNLRPKLLVTYGDDLQDSGSQAVFGQSNKIRIYNRVNGQYANFFSGSQAVTGSDCLMLVMVASKSVNITTSSWETNFSASITYTTSSYTYFSSSYSSSLSSIGNLPLTGYYEANVQLNPQLTSSLATYLGSDKTATFQTYWKSLDGTVLYSSGSWLTFTLPQAGEMVSSERNFVVSVTNLKEEYVQSQVPRLRVFIQDRNTEQPALRLPTPARSVLLGDMYWRLLKAFSREVVIPFHSIGTKLSSDGFGRYFDMYMEDLDPQEVYELEFQITEAGRDYFITNEGFRFKVIP